MTSIVDLVARPGRTVSDPERVARGFLGRCPACGEGHLFGRYLKVAPACEACGTQFHHHRADDFPPYVVMFIVCHIVGYGIYVSETRFDEVALWIHMALWPALTLLLSLALLQPVKGAVVALQYVLGMHGFDAELRRRGDRRERGWSGGVPDEGGPGARLGAHETEGRRDADPDRPQRTGPPVSHGKAA